MTDTDQGNQEMIDRYLADRLNDTERELVEIRIVGDAGFRHQVELTEALRDGLRELQRQGKVEPLLKKRTWMWRRSPYAIAASIMALALGLATLLFYQRLERAQENQATTPDELVVATLRFEQTRGGDDGPDVTWQRRSAPALLDMQFDVGLEPASGYRILIDRIGAEAAVPVLQANAASISPDGVASISVHSALLEPGDYRIRLEPKPTGPAQPESTIYTLRVAD